MYSGEQAANKILIEVLVLTHLIDLLPLSICHLLTDDLCCHFLTTQILAPKLWRVGDQILINPL